jgi:hypothetical protein
MATEALRPAVPQVRGKAAKAAQPLLSKQNAAAVGTGAVYTCPYILKSGRTNRAIARSAA